MFRQVFQIFTTPEYDEWLFALSIKEQIQIDKRMMLIECEGYFGDHKTVSTDHSIYELRWKNGRRIYYSYIEEQKVLLLIGGNKNGQNRDVSQAKRLYARWSQS